MLVLTEVWDHSSLQWPHVTSASGAMNREHTGHCSLHQLREEVAKEPQKARASQGKPTSFTSEHHLCP